MKKLQWFKQAMCPYNQHAVRRGGQVWQLRPSIAVPPDDTNSLCSGETLFQDPDDPRNDVSEDYNHNIKKVFQDPSVQELVPHDNLLNKLCTILLKEVKQANPLKWVNQATSARVEVDELIYWKDQMKQDIDSMMSQLQTKLYIGLEEICGEMQNLFQEEEDEMASDVQDVPRMTITNPDSPDHRIQGQDAEKNLTEL